MNIEDRPPSPVALTIMGIVIGALSGVLLCFAYQGEPNGLDFILWGGSGALLLSIASVVTGGRVVSFIFLPFQAGTPLRRMKAEDYSTSGAVLISVGVYLVAYTVEMPWMNRLEGWRLYAMVITTAVAAFIWLPILSRLSPRVIFPVGILAFALGALVMFKWF